MNKKFVCEKPVWAGLSSLPLLQQASRPISHWGVFLSLRMETKPLTEPSCWMWVTWRPWRSTTMSVSSSAMWTWSPWMIVISTSVSISLDTCLCPWTSLASGENTAWNLGFYPSCVRWSPPTQFISCSQGNGSVSTTRFYLPRYGSVCVVRQTFLCSGCALKWQLSRYISIQINAYRPCPIPTPPHSQ